MKGEVNWHITLIMWFVLFVVAARFIKRLPDSYTHNMHVCVNTRSLNSSRLRMREAPFLEVTNLSKRLMRLTSWSAISAVSEKNPQYVYYAISEGRGQCEAFNFILKSKTIYYTFRWWLNRSRWLLVELESLLCFSSSGLFSGTGFQVHSFLCRVQ